MTFVIGQGCCNDASCVAVCPVQCIRPRPGDPDFVSTEQLYIDPASCIDCGACARACPVGAIHHVDALPPELGDFRGINAAYFAARPLRDVVPPAVTRHKVPEHSRLRVAIVGSGPSAMYAAAELSELPRCTVTVLERQPAPFGLVRAGVAPDHQRTKLIGDRFERVLRRPNVRCFFNVDVGRDVTVPELLEHHHAVLWAGGSTDDRKLGVPGEDLPGVVSAREFVGWYNGHPDFADRRFDFRGHRAVVIGNGNVALDVARVLAQPVEAYERTSMSDLAIKALGASAITEVVVVGRRGQAHAAYGTAELLALSRLDTVDLLARSDEVSVTREEILAARSRMAPALFERRRATVRAAADRTPRRDRRRIVLRYRRTPVEVVGTDAVAGVVLEDPLGGRETVPTSLVIRSVGFRGRPAPGIPFDDVTGTIPHAAGRVQVLSSGEALPGLYCAGWIKRGSNGVIGTNRADSAETVASMLEDLRRGRLPQPARTSDQFAELVRQRCSDVIDAAGWRRIDDAERALGRAAGRDRVKFLSYDHLAHEALRGGTAGAPSDEHRPSPPHESDEQALD